MIIILMYLLVILGAVPAYQLFNGMCLLVSVGEVPIKTGFDDYNVYLV